MADEDTNYGGVDFPQLPDEQPQDQQPGEDWNGPPSPEPPKWRAPWDFVPRGGESAPTPTPDQGGGYGEPPGAWQEQPPSPPEPGNARFTGPVAPRWQTPWSVGQGSGSRGQESGYGEPPGAWAEVPPAPPEAPQYEPQIQTAQPGWMGLAPSAGAVASPLVGAQALYNVAQGAARGGVTPPDVWNAVATGARQGAARIGQFASDIGGGIGNVLNTFNKPFAEFSEPVIARNWLDIAAGRAGIQPTPPDATGLRPLPGYQSMWDAGRQSAALVRVDAPVIRRELQDWAAANPLQRAAEYVRQNPAPLPNPLSFVPFASFIAAKEQLPKYFDFSKGLWKELMGPLYGTPEEIQQYQERAPWLYQLGAGVAFDPLNLVNPISDEVVDGLRWMRAMAKVTPTTKTVAEITADMAREGQQSSGLVARLNPLRHTNEALQHELVQDAAEALTRIANAAPEGEGAQWVSMLARSPDTLAEATGGYAASPQAKRASALLQRLLTPEGGAQPEYRALEKIVKEAQGDEIAAVSALAAKLQGAAESFFPSSPRGTLRAGRDWVNNLLSAVYMGYSPGYAVRNASNNVLTALIDGVSPFENSGRLREFWTRWGPPPLNAKQGIGVAGSVWSSRDDALKYLSTISEPVRARDVAKSFFTLKQPTTQVAQMVERYFSERITYNAIRKYWAQTWAAALRDAERELTGLPADARELVVRRLRGVMSADEARAVVREIAGSGGDLGRSMPWSVAKAVEDAGGHELADVVRTVTEATGAPTAVEPILRHTEQTAEVVAGIRSLAGGSFEKDVNGLLGFMDRVDTFIGQAIDANDAAIDQLWQEAAKLPRETRSRLWQTHWQSFMKNMEQVHAEVDALQETMLPRFNFQGTDIRRFQESRQQTLTAWQQYVARLRATWEASDKMMALDQPVGDLWREFKDWRAEHWKRYRAARYQRIEQESQAIRRALVRTGANDLTSGAHAQASLDAWRHEFPDAYTVWAGIEGAKRAGRTLDAEGIGVSEKVMHRARQTGFVIGTGKGTKVNPTWLRANQIVEQMYEMAGARAPVQYVRPAVRNEMPEALGIWKEQPKALPAPRYPAYEKPAIVREGPLGKPPAPGGPPIPLGRGADTLQTALIKRGVPEYLVMRADRDALEQAEQLARVQQGLLKRNWSWDGVTEGHRAQMAEILNGGPITMRPQARNWTELTGETPRFMPPSDYVAPRVTREYPQGRLTAGERPEIAGLLPSEMGPRPAPVARPQPQPKTPSPSGPIILLGPDGQPWPYGARLFDVGPEPEINEFQQYVNRYQPLLEERTRLEAALRQETGLRARAIQADIDAITDELEQGWVTVEKTWPKRFARMQSEGESAKFYQPPGVDVEYRIASKVEAPPVAKSPEFSAPPVAPKAGTKQATPPPAAKAPKPEAPKPIKPKDIPFTPGVKTDRLAALKKLAMEAEERTGQEFWGRVPFAENPYYLPTRQWGQPIDGEALLADLQAAGYKNIPEWWDAEIAPVKYPKYVSRYSDEALNPSNERAILRPEGIDNATTTATTAGVREQGSGVRGQQPADQLPGEVPVPRGEDRAALENVPAQDVPRAEEVRGAGQGDLRSGGNDAEPGRATGIYGTAAGRSEGAGAGDLGAAGRAGRAGVGQQPGELGSTSAVSGRGAGERGSGGELAGGSDAAATPAPPSSSAQRAGNNYVITSPNQVGRAAAQRTAYRENVDAIKLLKQIEAENRLATPAEQAVLARYTGWGGIPQAVDPKQIDSWHQRYYGTGAERTTGRGAWADQYDELKTLLTDAEYEAARASTPNAHFTSIPIIQSMWQALVKLGFDGGRVLEPATGVGHFFGAMPGDLAARSTLHGVELDSLSARITKQLYQGADIRAAGYQEAALPNNFFRAIISNVPFGNYAVYDPAFKTNKFLTESIHNYYFAKSVDLAEPGGVIAFITSRYTMDSESDLVRKWLSSRTELLGAVRLPETAFKGNANTDVVTDVIFLRKLRKGEQATGESWRALSEATTAGGRQIPINEYFVRHPENILGRLDTTGTMYTAFSPTVADDGRDLQGALSEFIARLPQGKLAEVAPEANVAGAAGPRIKAGRRNMAEMQDGAFVVEGGKVKQSNNGLVRERQLSKEDAPRVAGMVRVREEARNVHGLMLQGATDEELKAAQARLSMVYDQFVAKQGPLHKPANFRAFADDPDRAFLMALEDYNYATKTGSKSDFFTKRTIQERPPVTHAETAQDALVATLQARGRVDLDHMAALTGRHGEDVAGELVAQGKVYKNPGGGWELNGTYLSGNVREKLRQAEAAAQLDPTYAPNVDALRAVLPPEVVPEQIHLPFGAGWVPAEHYEEFIQSLLGDRPKLVFNPVMQEWSFGAEKTLTHRRYGMQYNQAAQEINWGTNRMPADEIIQKIMNMRSPAIYDELADGKRVLNVDATFAAREKAEAIQAAWTKFWRADTNRAESIAKLYNETMNNWAAPVFDGSHLMQPGALPGLVSEVNGQPFKLRDYQANAIWRMVTAQGNTLLAHAVGAGKTAEMVAAGMELRRLGIAKKPMYVVPNHLVSQWAEQFLSLYPGAKILAIDKATFKGADGVREALSKIATGDWDAVIVRHRTFEDMAMSAKAQAGYQGKEIDALRAFLEQQRVALEASGAKLGNRSQVKRLEKRVKDAEARLQRQLQAKDKYPGLTFEELGVDQLFVDEAHGYKNLHYNSQLERVKGLGNPEGSQKARDMHLKTQYLSQLNGGRGVVFATGTPVSNSMVELFNVQRYLQPDVLEAMGAEHFDGWQRLFGEVVPSLERTATGAYQTVNRLKRFQNFPELMRVFDDVADIKATDELLQAGSLRHPGIKGGKPTIITIPRTNELEEFTKSLEDRAINLSHVDPSVDNMLVIMGDARKAALDMRLVNPGALDRPGSKLNTAANEIERIYGETKDYKGTQLVLIDMSTPKGKGDTGFSAYNDLRQKLEERGIPRNEIAFIHDYDTDEQKMRLFDAVNDGTIRVLFGSTEKVGTGTNIQTRLAALHELDVPWRWSDIEQREGRIMRPGNLHIGYDGNPLFGPAGRPVEIPRYVADGSLDEVLWTIVEAKAQMASAVMGKKYHHLREIVVDDEPVLTLAQMRAAASGRPEVLEKAGIEAQLAKLEGLNEHSRTQWSHQLATKKLPKQIEDITKRAEGWRRAADATREQVALHQGKLVASVGGTVIDAKTDAPFKALGQAIDRAMSGIEKGVETPIGEVYGWRIEAVEAAGQHQLYLKHPSGVTQALPGWIAEQGINPVTLGQRVQEGVQNAIGHVDWLDKEATRLRRELVLAQEQLGKGFEHGEKLAQLRARNAELEKILAGGKRDEQIIDVTAGMADEGLNLADETGAISLAPMYDVMDAGRHAAGKVREVLQDWGKWHNPSEPVAPLTPEQAAHLWEWTNKRAIPEMIQAKAITGDLASQTRDFALLDYADRRNLDSWLSWVFPYSYWYTRTFGNFAQRIAANPALVSNYARMVDQIKQANQSYYRQQTGDPNAQLPEYWERQVRVPWFGNDLYFNLDAALNPLNSLVSDFTTRARGEAPGGEFVQKLNNYGPTIWSPWIWGYAAWLWANGYQDAAQEWVGYIMPQSRAIKGLSALAREPGTALNSGIQALGATQAQIEGLIPAGGSTPEGLAGLPTVQGGDIWERKRIGYFLYRLLDEGVIDEKTFRDTAYAQSGPVWDRARQMEAVERAPGSLMSWGLGSGFKRRTQADIDVAQMWDANSEVWDKRPEDPESVEYQQWRRELDAFNDKYPWAKGVQLAQKLDPVRRLQDFMSMVLDAIPPGKERYRVYDEIGGSDIIDQFYASKRKIAGWGAAEIEKLKDTATRLAAKYGAPTPADRATWDQAQQIHSYQMQQAVAQVNALSGPTTWSAMTQEDLRLIEDRYFQIPETDKVNRRAYLDEHPALQAWWDAKRAATAMSVPNEGIAGAPQMRRGLTAEQAQKITAPFWPPSEGNPTRDALVAAKGEAWVKQAETLEKAYLNAGPSRGAERSAWAVAHKAEYGTLKVLWELRDGIKAGSAAANAGAGPEPTGTLGLANWKPGAPGVATSTAPGHVPAATQVATTGARAILPGYSAAEAVKRFGQDIFGLESEYLDLDTEGRKKWRAANAQEYAQLAQYWDFKYGPGTGSDLAPGYSDAEAIKRFGADILTLDATYTALDTAGRTAWRAANAQAYARLKTFWDFKYGPQTSTSSGAGGGYVGGSSGYSGRGGGGRAPVQQPVPPAPTAPPTNPPDQQPPVDMGQGEYDDLTGRARASDPAFDRLAKLLFGPDVMTLAGTWMGMDAAGRAAWRLTNPLLYARLMRYLLWLRTTTAAQRAAQSKTIAGSVPGRAPQAPPIPPS